MTEIKTSYVSGWAPEATLGDPGNGDFTALLAGDTAYLFGDYKDTPAVSIVPVVDQVPVYLLDSYNFDALTEKKFHLKCMADFLLMDGLPFYYTLGKVADGDDAGTKTHAITGIVPSEDLPSFTLHYEADDPDATSNIDKDVFACRVNSLKLEAERFKGVRIKLDIIGLDWDDSVHLTSAPALKPTAVDSMFLFSQGTYTWNAVPQGHILSFSMEIKNNLKPIHVDRATNKHRAKYLRMQGNRITSWSMTFNLKNKTLIDEIKANIARSFTVVFQRTDANDNITITLANSVGQGGSLNMMQLSENQWIFSGIAKTPSMDVRDAITSYD